MKGNSCNNNVNCNNGGRSNFLIIVVLYILLAIIVGSAYRYNNY